MARYFCIRCNSTNVSEVAEPEFHWATFVLNGVMPVHIQKLKCIKCDKVFGKIIEEDYPAGDLLVQVHGNETE